MVVRSIVCGQIEHHNADKPFVLSVKSIAIEVEAWTAGGPSTSLCYAQGERLLAGLVGVEMGREPPFDTYSGAFASQSPDNRA